jgi:hypothetical protein
MGKRGSAVTCGSPPRRRPYSADAASRRHRALPLKLIMKIGPLPDACQTPAGRTGTRLSLRQNALDPGFHCALAHWTQGFMAFQPVRRTWNVLLMVPE